MINLEKLNEAQRKAVTTLSGQILCLAGAGSGKTTTLTYRVANLIEKGVNPASILLLTFTKKAAREMLNRVNSLVGSKGSGVEGGTFHHFAVQIISRFWDKLGINRNFTVIDDKDSADIIYSIRQSINSRLANFNLPTNRYSLFQIISRARNHEESIEATLNRDMKKANTDVEGLELINSEYQKYKKSNNLLDYDDLLDYLHIFLKDPNNQNELSERYKHIIVDEYQDTNNIQSRITDLLSIKAQSLMVVGDDAQSIYSFRGSNIDNIVMFSKKYPNSSVIKLEENYRSCGYILEGCNSLIANSKTCIKKELFTKKPRGNKIALVRCESDKEEATLVAKRIIQLYNLGYSLNDLAVLFRNSNYSYELEIELAKRNIPYKKYGGPKIFASEHIRDIISYLRILNNPYDRISWIRILMQIKGIGIQTANYIFEEIKNQPEPFDFTNLKVRSEHKNELNKLSKMLLDSVTQINSNPSNILNFIIDYYLPNLKAYSKENFSLMLKDLDQIALVASKYQNLQSLLTEMFIESGDEDKEPNIDTKTSPMYLTLSTIHSAKGLEWKQVFILSALEGRFPLISSAQNPNELEEERRLMYVAMTRAQEGLTISYPSGIWDKNSREFLTQPSRFIKEISPSSLEIWQIKH